MEDTWCKTTGRNHVQCCIPQSFSDTVMKLVVASWEMQILINLI